MAAAVSTRTTDLGASRVRVEVEVEPRAIERQVEDAARAMARDLKLPGFRKGKVPAPVVIQRVGREAVLDEAVRRGLPSWYEQAVSDAGLATVGDPKVNLRELPEKGSPLAFSIEVAVRPQARLGDYRGLEVGRREPEVAPADVEAELQRLRESVASLETADRPARKGDFVVVDFTGTVDDEPFEGGEARGYLLELGSGRLIEGFEEQLLGAVAGEEREVKVTFPADHGGEAGSEERPEPGDRPSLAGREAVFATTVKEVKEKRLPELDDDFASDAGGFDTLAELREDIEARLREAELLTIEREFREAVVDAAAAAASIDLPEELVHAKAHEMWERTARRLAAQGLDPARYLQMTGKTEEEIVREAQPDAERALRRESVLAAVVEAERIEVSDDELVEALREAASAAPPGEPSPPEPSEAELRKSLERARAQGRDELLREDIAMRKAVDLLVEAATPISVDQAKARDKLWTPEKAALEQPEKGAAEQPEKLWTPGS